MGRIVKGIKNEVTSWSCKPSTGSLQVRSLGLKLETIKNNQIQIELSGKATPKG
jgi:hypothetical protein